MKGKPRSRDRIIDAALELASEVGPGHLSLDSVAKRAGVSKGGLLYNFPTKAALLEALVAKHLESVELGLARHHAGNGAAGQLIEAYIEHFQEEEARTKAPDIGFLAALVENPNLVLPVRRFNRALLDRLCADAADSAAALVVFMAIQGLRCGPLLDMDVLTKAERRQVVEGLRALVKRPAA